MATPLTKKDLTDALTPITGDIHEIKVKMFDPDEGLYARVERNTVWRKIHMYIYGSATGGAIVVAIQHFF